MKATTRLTAVSLIALLLIASSTACSRAIRTDSVSGNEPPSCSQLLTAAVDYARTDTGDMDAVLQALTDTCSNEYEIAVDYVAHARESKFRIESCDELLGYGIRSESVTLLEQDGWCSFGATPPVAAAPDWPEGGLGWDSARAHAGTVQRVCGPLTSMRDTGDGTFVNIGQDYPSADRFTFIFWDVYLDPIETGATICGSGEIYLYEGVAQMEMWDPSALEIWR